MRPVKTHGFGFSHPGYCDFRRFARSNLRRPLPNRGNPLLPSASPARNVRRNFAFIPSRSACGAPPSIPFGLRSAYRVHRNVRSCSCSSFMISFQEESSLRSRGIPTLSALEQKSPAERRERGVRPRPPGRGLPFISRRSRPFRPSQGSLFGCQTAYEAAAGRAATPRGSGPAPTRANRGSGRARGPPCSPSRCGRRALLGAP